MIWLGQCLFVRYNTPGVILDSSTIAGVAVVAAAVVVVFLLLLLLLLDCHELGISHVGTLLLL